MGLHGFKGDAPSRRFQAYDAVRAVRLHRHLGRLVQEIVPDDVHRGRAFRLQCQPDQAGLRIPQGKFQGCGGLRPGAASFRAHFISFRPRAVFVLPQDPGESPVYAARPVQRGPSDIRASAAGQICVRLPPVPGRPVERTGFHAEHAQQGDIRHLPHVRHRHAALLDDAPCGIFRDFGVFPPAPVLPGLLQRFRHHLETCLLRNLPCAPVRVSFPQGIQLHRIPAPVGHGLRMEIPVGQKAASPAVLPRCRRHSSVHGKLSEEHGVFMGGIIELPGHIPHDLHGQPDLPGRNLRSGRSIPGKPFFPGFPSCPGQPPGQVIAVCLQPPKRRGSRPHAQEIPIQINTVKSMSRHGELHLAARIREIKTESRQHIRHGGLSRQEDALCLFEDFPGVLCLSGTFFFHINIQPFPQTAYILPFPNPDTAPLLKVHRIYFPLFWILYTKYLQKSICYYLHFPSKFCIMSRFSPSKSR